MLPAKRDHHAIDHGRRRLLRTAVGAALGVASGALFAVPMRAREYQLAFYNTHTGESLTTVYAADGHYIPDALDQINHILRDFRTDTTTAIDLDLLNMLHRLRARLGVSRYAQFHIISGYRSPQTNAELRNKSQGVAKKSLHMLGKAIDIRLPGVELAQLRQAAIDLNSGGVGFYPRSNFIHVDTGRVRTW